MKTPMLRYSLKEGLHSIVRHPLVTLVSVSTIALMLVLLSAFILFSLNARSVMAQAGQQPPVEITMNLDVAPEQLLDLAEVLAADETVLEYTLFTPEENFASFKQSMENDDLFADFPITNIPYTFAIRLTDPAEGEGFQNRVLAQPGVRKVALEQTVMQFLSKAIVFVNYATLIVFSVLILIALFIISNMVRIAVFSRGEEISIMKYVGATNWYIRVPFIIEGALVGLVGALLAWGLACFGYDRLFYALMRDVRPDDVLAMLEPSLVSGKILLTNLLIGIGVGAIGSVLSVRRHITV